MQPLFPGLQPSAGCETWGGKCDGKDPSGNRCSPLSTNSWSKPSTDGYTGFEFQFKLLFRIHPSTALWPVRAAPDRGELTSPALRLQTTEKGWRQLPKTPPADIAPHDVHLAAEFDALQSDDAAERFVNWLRYWAECHQGDEKLIESALFFFDNANDWDMKLPPPSEYSFITEQGIGIPRQTKDPRSGDSTTQTESSSCSP